MNRLDFGVVLQSVFTEFTTDTRALETSERNLGVELVVTVDPQCTGLTSAFDMGMKMKNEGDGVTGRREGRGK